MNPEYDEDIGIADPALDRSPKTLNRWVNNACKEFAADTNEEGWLDVTYHDLRRTWGT